MKGKNGSPTEIVRSDAEQAEMNEWKVREMQSRVANHDWNEKPNETRERERECRIRKKKKEKEEEETIRIWARSFN